MNTLSSEQMDIEVLKKELLARGYLTRVVTKTSSPVTVQAGESIKNFTNMFHQELSQIETQAIIESVCKG